MKKKSFFSFLLFLALCYIIAGLGSFATDTSLTPWYVELKKSNWNPPAWVFAPVWTILYFLIAIAGWLLFTAESSKKRTQALLFYFLQLTCNGIWSFLFFYFSILHIIKYSL
jgi:tryptophan-rich sensory protein